MAFLKVENRDDLVRDTKSKAILAADKTLLEEHRKKKRFLSSLKNTAEEVESLKKDVQEIKDLLYKLLDK